VPSVEEHVNFIKAVLKSHNYDDAIFIGHSWGSNVVSWITQSDPSVVAAAIFLDPVCFLLQLNNITKNWFYKAKEADQTLIKSLMGLVKTELFSVNTLQRNLVWFRNIIWPHELQERNIRTCIIVSSDDHIVPSKEVLASINQHNSENPSSDLIEIHELASADHGGLVFDENFREETATIIKNVIQKL
jgi:pimeloyl-ACP methyl ester carboxylesterase